MSGRVFRRSTSPNPPVAGRGHGSTIVDADGREYLDAAGGAIVVNVGHGRREIADAIAEQAGAARVRPRQRVHDRAARALRRARSRRTCRWPTPRSTRSRAGPRRSRPRSSSPGRRSSRAASRTAWSCSRAGAATTATRSARSTCRGGGRCAARTRAWLGRFRHVSAAYPYRGDDPGSQALGTTQALVDELDQAFTMAEPGTVAAFVAEPIVGATLGAVEPPPGYWPAIADVCRRHGALLIADEVMTGFGRTGAWFGMTHYGVQPDLLVAAKGATSGYWPFGFVAASGEVYDAVTRRRPVRPRVHLLAPAGRPRRSRARCCGSSRPSRWSSASATKGERLTALLHERLDASPAVGDIRGPRADGRRGARPRPRDARAVAAGGAGWPRRSSRTARERGLLLYSGTGNANGVDGDTILLGPPFVVTDDELVADRGRARRGDRPRRGVGRGRRPRLT